MSRRPTLEQVLTLPVPLEGAVRPDQIDQNGHLNISHYFSMGSVAPWRLLEQAGADRTYIPERGLSFFTVGHHLGYLGELLEGDAYAVHAGFVGRTDKAVHAFSAVVDRTRDRLSCLVETTYVHVAMSNRRATSIPADVAAGIEERTEPWLAEVAVGLSLRR